MTEHVVRVTVHGLRLGATCAASSPAAVGEPGCERQATHTGSYVLAAGAPKLKHTHVYGGGGAKLTLSALEASGGQLSGDCVTAALCALPLCLCLLCWL
jgi:hypothetical protein